MAFRHRQKKLAPFRFFGLRKSRKSSISAISFFLFQIEPTSLGFDLGLRRGREFAAFYFYLFGGRDQLPPDKAFPCAVGNSALIFRQTRRQGAAVSFILQAAANEV
jgi:hypothetical protein